MELLYWPSENKWSLPSIDLESLQLLAYVKFTEANVNITSTYKSLLQKKGRTLPCLCLPDEETITTNKEIIKYLQLKHFNTDTWLTEEMKNTSIVLRALIEDKLIPAVQASLWLDSANYTEVIRPVFAKNCRYPINFTEAKKIHDRYDEFITVSKAMHQDEAVKVKKLTHEATEALISLSEYLKDKDFLFGHRSSSVDALLFSCLAPLVKIPLSSGTLQNEVRKTQNLCQYVDRILQRYFKEERKSEEEQKQTRDEKAEKKTETTSEEDENKYDWVMPVCVATVAMVSYAVNAGLLLATTEAN